MTPLVCRHCGTCDTPVVGPGTGPHVARLDCAACGYFLKWAPRVLVQSLLEEKEPSMVGSVNQGDFGWND